MKAKRILAVVLLAALLLASLPLTAWAAPPVPTAGADAAPAIPGAPKIVTAKSGLKLREGPSLSDPVITVLSYGQTVYPAGGPVWGDGISWTFVKVHRGAYWYEGFCATVYLGLGGGSPPASHGLKVTAPAGLRLRSGPGTGYAIWRIVPYGAMLQPTGAKRWGNGILWSQVVIGGSNLWGASAYLTPV